jgi:arylformamidase
LKRTPPPLRKRGSRHRDLLRAPVVVIYGTHETREFQRQNCDFAAAAKAAGKPIESIAAENYDRFETEESPGNPYGPNRRSMPAQ